MLAKIIGRIMKNETTGEIYNQYNMQQKRNYHYKRARRDSPVTEFERGISIGWITRDKQALRNARYFRNHNRYRYRRRRYY